MHKYEVQELPKELDPARRRQLKIEVLVLLVVAALPDLANAVLSLLVDWPESTALLDSAGHLDRSLRVGAAVLYMMWRSGEPRSVFGLTRMRWHDPLVGAVLYGGFWMLLIGVYSGAEFQWGFRAIPRESNPIALPADPLEWALVALVG